MSERIMADNPKGHMQIDGGYGDFAMSIFRVKDRRRWMHDVPTLFTEERKAKIIGCFPNNTMSERELHEFISQPRSLQK